MEFETNLKVRSSLVQDIDLSSTFLMSPTSIKLTVGGRHGQNDISGLAECNLNWKDSKYNLLIMATKNQIVAFQTSVDVDLGERKNLALNILAGQRITLDASVGI